MKLLKGKKLADEILKNLKNEVKGKKLKLTVVLTGENSTSLIFVKEKEKACKKIGIDFELLKFPVAISQTDLAAVIKKLAADNSVSGIVLQLPLPENINSQEMLNIIPPEKDVDVLSDSAFEKFKGGELTIIPPVVAAVSRLIDEYKIKLADKKIVLVGFGKLVGLPVSAWLTLKGIGFSVVDKTTLNPEIILREADVIISGTGKPGLIVSPMIKQDAVVIDASTALKYKKLVGDVDFDSVSKKASYITPVPGGIGPLTVACLLENLVKLNNK